MFYGAFLGPIGAILIFNSIIFVIVAKTAIKHRRKKSAKGETTVIGLISRLICVTFLFGLTWVFGALTIVSEASLAFQILFATSILFRDSFCFCSSVCLTKMPESHGIFFCCVAITSDQSDHHIWCHAARTDIHKFHQIRILQSQSSQPEVWLMELL